MYTHTHTRIRNYVMVGADLPPPGAYRVKLLNIELIKRLNQYIKSFEFAGYIL